MDCDILLGKITVNNHEIDWHEGMTIKDMLAKMNYTFAMIVVKIDGKVYQRDTWATTVVPDGSVVDAIHLISGG